MSKTRQELYEQAKDEYLVPLRLQLTIEQANALYRAVAKAYVNDDEPEIGEKLPPGLLTHLHESLGHAYEFCSDLAQKREITQQGRV